MRVPSSTTLSEVVGAIKAVYTSTSSGSSSSSSSSSSEESSYHVGWDDDTNVANVFERWRPVEG